MGLFSKWKPKTIAGKILKGVVQVATPVAAIATGVGAIGGAISGAGLIGGAISGIKTTAKVAAGVVGVAKRTVSTVGSAAANLLTGQTQEQRKLVRDQKAQTRADMAKLETVDKLIKAGAKVEEAATKAGVPIGSLAGMFGLPTAEEIEIMPPEVKPAAVNGKNVGLLVAALAGILLLANIKGR